MARRLSRGTGAGKKSGFAEGKKNMPHGRAADELTSRNT